MRRIFLLILALFIFPSVSVSEVIHMISPEEDIIYINSTLILKSDKILDYWDLTLSLPRDSEIIEVRDEIGDVAYTMEDESLELRTNSKRSKLRVINISYSLPAAKKKQGLIYAELNLFGFANDTTYAKTDRKIPYFFAPNALVEYGENETKAKKEGPISIVVAYGGKTETDHYFTNSNVNLSEAERFYPMIEGLTGIKVPVKFGIVVLSENEYEGELQDWSTGTFNGMIFVKETKDKRDTTATIIHETVHGFNAFALDWDSTNLSWFDEGVASYVTSAIYRVLEKPQPELFGGEKKWIEKRVIYTLRPKKTPEDLWGYYLGKQKYMSYWYPQSEFDREFGYAYSELFIREYLYDNGSALHRVYRELLDINESIYDENERNKIVTGILGTSFTPCYSKSLDGIKECTKRLNEMTFQIPAAGGTGISYTVEDPQIPKEEEYAWSFLNDLLSRLSQNLKKIFSFFSGIF